MQVWQYIFIISCLIVFYNYAGYAMLAYFLNALTKKKSIPSGEGPYTPSVSFIVAAFNEEGVIEKKIINSQEQNYPGEIEFLFITDGSSDRTMEIVAKYPGVKLLHEPERRGKSAALNRAVREAKNDILIFSDANTVLNKDATMKITGHYRDKKTGGVAGEKKVMNLSSVGIADETGAGEGMYWKYESLLKKTDSEFYSVVGAAGELFSLRRELYEFLPDNTILDDFVLSLKVAQKGFRFIYEPGAFAMELPSFSLKDEQKRKIRIAAGGFQSIGMLLPLLFFWKQPRLSFLYISHRVLRWTLSPLCLILSFISNLVLYWGSGNVLFKISFLAQVCFYGMAVLARWAPGNKLFKIPYYFTFMNVSVLLGFFRFLRGSQSAVWEKAKRVQQDIIIE